MNIWVAAGDGDQAAVEQALESGVSVNAKDGNGYTPVHAAASYGHKDLLLYLLNKGGDVNVKDNCGDTPLHYTETVEIAEILLDNNADLEAQNNDGETPLGHALEDAENIDLIRFLHEKSGGEDSLPENFGITLGYQDDSTPLDEARHARLTEIIESGSNAELEEFVRECAQENQEAGRQGN